MTLKKSERQAVAAFYAAGREVTQCPPRTFALDASKALGFRELGEASWRIAQRAKAARRANEKLSGTSEQRTSPQTRAAYAAVARPDRTAAEVAEILGVRRKNAQTTLRKYGLPYAKQSSGKRPGQGVDEAQYRELAQRMTAEEMATHLDRHVTTVRSNLERIGIRAVPAENVGRRGKR